MKCKHFLLTGGGFLSSRAGRGIYRIAHGFLAALGMTRGMGREMPGGDRGCGQNGRTAGKALCDEHRTTANHRGSRWQLAGDGWERGSPEPHLVILRRSRRILRYARDNREERL